MFESLDDRGKSRKRRPVDVDTIAKAMIGIARRGIPTRPTLAHPQLIGGGSETATDVQGYALLVKRVGGLADDADKGRRKRRSLPFAATVPGAGSSGTRGHVASGIAGGKGE